MSHFVKLNGSFQQGPGKGDKKAVFFGLESHTMAEIAEFFPKNILALFALKIQRVLCLPCFFETLEKQPCKWRSDLVLNEQMKGPK